MNDRFEDRLNQVLPRVLSPDVLDNRGAGGEIGFWIFDYPVEREMEMRQWLVDVIQTGIQRQRPDLRYKVIDLFQEVMSILEERNLLEKVYEKQTNSGDAALLASLRSVLKEDRLAARFAQKFDVANLDLLIVKGVGAVYPMLRTHTLLSALHPHMSHTPLLMLYPGVYDGLSLKLFNTLTDDNYYRAFRLVS